MRAHLVNDHLLNLILVSVVAFLFISCDNNAVQNKSYSDFINDLDHPAFNEELIFSIKGDSVSGYAFIANDSTLKETVVLVAGYPGNDNNFDVAQSLRRNGKNVVHFNHRGAWGSQGVYTYSNCLEDIDEVLEYLCQLAVAQELRIDTNRITLLGRSYGGGVSLIRGARNERVNKIIAITSVNYGTVMRKYNDLNELASFKRYMDKQVMIDTDVDVFLQEMLDKKEEFEILNYKELLQAKEVLIIEDSDKNDQWISQLTNAEVVKLESGHSFIDKRIEMIDLIVDWLEKPDE